MTVEYQQGLESIAHSAIEWTMADPDQLVTPENENDSLQRGMPRREFLKRSAATGGLALISPAELLRPLTKAAISGGEKMSSVAKQEMVMPLTPEKVELVVPGQLPNTLNFDEFGDFFPQWTEVINNATPQVQNFVNQKYPGFTIDSFRVVVQAIEEDDVIRPTQTPDTTTSQKLNFLYTHGNGGIDVKFNPENVENPWSFNAYDNHGMISAIVAASDQDLLGLVTSADVEQLSPEDKVRRSEFIDTISKLYVYPDVESGNLRVIDRELSHLGVVSEGVVSIDQNGNKSIEWRPRYEIQDNARLVANEQNEREQAPSYVRIDDSLLVEDLGVTWRFGNVMSSDPSDPHNTLEPVLLTDKFKADLTNFTTNHMQDFRGMTITIRFVDEKDEQAQKHLNSEIINENFEFLQYKVKRDGAPVNAMGAKAPKNNHIQFNLFVDRSQPLTSQDMNVFKSRAIMSSVIFIKEGVYIERGGDPYSTIEDRDPMMLELGATYDPATETPIIEVHNPS